MPNPLRLPLPLPIILIHASIALASDSPGRLARVLHRFDAAEAHQGVAVDESHFYAVTNRAVGKYDKHSGKLVKNWQASGDSPLRHLNGAMVVDGKLYGAHSNWPNQPRRNSIEIWDTETLEHVGRREFDQNAGALNWVDRHDGHWWVVFAFYDPTGPDSVARTTLIQFDDRWQRQAAWTFPDEVIQRFAPHSNSGGSFGLDGRLYVTGHDRAEMYALRVPRRGSVLELVDVVPTQIAGQGIAWDRSDIGIVYGIVRSRKQVVKSRISHASEYDRLQRGVVWKRDERNPILAPGPRGSFDSTRCMNPWVLTADGECHLYYSGGDDRGRQRICLATARVDDPSQWHRHGPLFETGAEGAFDARWCVLPHVVPFAADRWHLYYTGNAGRGQGLSAFPGIGLAVRRNGQTWTKHAANPVLRPSGQAGGPDAMGMAGGSVINVALSGGKTEWRFYYTGAPTVGTPLPLNQQKTICLAVSQDGIRWQKRGAVMLRDPDRDYENIGVAGPVVQRQADGGFRMWYSAIGTRWGYYSICYAESADGIHWRRGRNYGDNLQLTPQGDGWEQQMVEYPTVIREGAHLRLFYCGNGYGQTGIGTAVGTED